jgi:cullin 1|tara:strand:+ start:165 stop:728 length:564 start_codon:yes stop_codon:yes gene_type:complete
VRIFTYLSDKDLFKEIYKNQLAKRLLNAKSASDDAEKSMISKLKMQCGATFTQHMEGMMNDLAQSGDQEGDYSTKKYKEFLKKAGADGAEIPTVDFNVKVLTGGNWPSYKQYNEMTLPSEMEKSVHSFDEFHTKVNVSRKLTWSHSQGTAIVKGTFGEGKKKSTFDINVTTLQAVAFMLFQDGVELG